MLHIASVYAYVLSSEHNNSMKIILKKAYRRAYRDLAGISVGLSPPLVTNNFQTSPRFLSSSIETNCTSIKRFNRMESLFTTNEGRTQWENVS